MVRKLSKIEEAIHSRSIEFREHLEKILPINVLRFVESLQQRTEVYLFSGVIRDFFLKDCRGALRDIDFIVESDKDVQQLFPELKIYRNSFDGLKTKVSPLWVDLWQLDRTWGLNRGQLNLPFKKLDTLPSTTFFNFSSIVFSFNENKFTIGRPFLRFLRDRTMDIVLEENPFPSLCIVNTFYYSEKYGLKISPKLIRYILENYESQKEDLELIQKKHFRRILYPNKVLLDKVKNLRNSF